MMGNKRRGLAEDKAQADIPQMTPPPPVWDICGIPQEASSCLNVNALLEGKEIFNLTQQGLQYLVGPP